MNFMQLLFSNPVLNVALLSWSSAQVIKTIIHAIKYKTFVPERLFGAGGMPSCHSATVCGMTVAIARVVGYSSPIFAIAVVVALVVMYDAMGVRQQAGMHAKMLNILLLKDKEEHKEDEDSDLISDELNLKKGQYKEYLGHTPLQVAVGAALGICIGFLLPF